MFEMILVVDVGEWSEASEMKQAADATCILLEIRGRILRKHRQYILREFKISKTKQAW